MSDYKPKRLSKIAKEFNIGITTLTEFLASKDIDINSNPNTKVDEASHKLLLSEFSSEKNTKEESKKIDIGFSKEVILQEKNDTPEIIKTEFPKKPELKILGKLNIEKKEKKTPEVEEKIPEKEDSTELKTQYQKLETPKILGKIEVAPKKERIPVASSSNITRKKRRRIPSDSKKNKKEKKIQEQKSKEILEKEIQEKVNQTLAKLTNKSKNRSVKYRKEKRQAVNEQAEIESKKLAEHQRTIKVTEFVTVGEFASMMELEANEVISACMSLGLFMSVNQRLDAETLTLIAEEYNYKIEFISAEDEFETSLEEEDNIENLTERPPIVTIMGHVDHGKTSLLDYIRSSNIISREAGGITQHIGAYSVENKSGKRITFLDTPGHEAFTAMRARGTQVTDIVIIVIAADDKIMPQTKEAINHAQAANVPIIFAFNKIDKETANPDKLKEELSAINILVEDWGGKFQSQEISAKKGTGIDDLLEKIMLEAELLELKADPKKNASGTIIESELDHGKGYVSTVIIQSGTAKLGDVIIAGGYSGKIKAMFNEKGQKIKIATPSTPVQILGFNGAPRAGDKFHVMKDEKEAKAIAEKILQLIREQKERVTKRVTLDDIGKRIAIGDFKELNLIIKGDVDGSIEALSEALLGLSTEKIKVNILHKSVGQISESDVVLATASEAIIVGFQVRPSSNARKLAQQEQIEIKLYSVIYKAKEEIHAAMEGMLAPTIEEKVIGNVEIREVFKISKIGTIAGCMVTDGKITRNSKVRIVRNGIVVYNGELDSLKRFKDDVKEVLKGFECGLNIKNFNDIKVNDNIEVYEEVSVKQTL